MITNVLHKHIYLKIFAYISFLNKLLIFLLKFRIDLDGKKKSKGSYISVNLCAWRD